MTTAAASPSGTASLSQRIANPPKDVNDTVTVLGEGAVGDEA